VVNCLEFTRACQKGTALVSAMVWNPKPMMPDRTLSRRPLVVWSTVTMQKVNVMNEYI
jgi:hypothetical protein